MYAVHVDGREVLGGFLSLSGARSSRNSLAQILPSSRVEIRRDPYGEPRSFSREHAL